MNILTKISIVVLLVLILTACVVFVTQATVPANYKLLYEQEKVAGGIDRMNARAKMNELLDATAALDTALTQLKELKLAKASEVSGLEASLASSRAQIAQMLNNNKALASALTGLKNELKTSNDRSGLLTVQLATSRKTNNDLTKENIRLDELVKQAEAGKDRLDKVARVNAERSRELEEENEQLRAGGATGRSTAGGYVPAVSSEKIIGTITAIKGDLASINIGSAKGVKRNMKLIIHRGPQMVAYLRIADVDIDQAAGVITDRQLEPMTNDKVTNLPGQLAR